MDKLPPLLSINLVCDRESASHHFLFAMYVNDMEEAPSRGNTGVTVDDVKLFLLFYADDAVIFAESAEELQNSINILFKYCNRWKLKLNTDKSHVIVFKRGRKSNKEKWVYGTMELKVISNIDYLGLRLSSTGSFHQAQQKLASQANKAVFILQKRLNNYPYLTPKHAMELFDKMITPRFVWRIRGVGIPWCPWYWASATKVLLNGIGSKIDCSKWLYIWRTE